VPPPPEVFDELRHLRDESVLCERRGSGDMGIRVDRHHEVFHGDARGQPVFAGHISGDSNLHQVSSTTVAGRRAGRRGADAPVEVQLAADIRQEPALEQVRELLLSRLGVASPVVVDIDRPADGTVEESIPKPAEGTYADRDIVLPQSLLEYGRLSVALAHLLPSAS
jgi:hypothetical protein